MRFFGDGGSKNTLGPKKALFLAIFGQNSGFCESNGALKVGWGAL